MWIDPIFNVLMSGAFGKLNPKKLAIYENSIEWQNTFINFFNIALDTLKWNGLPDTCDERFFNIALINRGMAGLVYDKEYGGWLSLPVSNASMINIYGYPSKVWAHGVNGYNKEFNAYIPNANNDDADAYVCYDNKMRYPYIFYICKYAERITNAKRSIDTAAEKLKNPYFIKCSESQASSVRLVLKKIKDNEDAVIVSDALDMDAFEVFPTQQDVNSLKVLWENFVNMNNDFRTTLGIQNNAATSKRERLITDEVNSNDIYTDINLDMRLRCRQEFCDMFNKATGLSIGCERNIKRSDDFEDSEEGIQDVESVDFRETSGLDME